MRVTSLTAARMLDPISNTERRKKYETEGAYAYTYLPHEIRIISKTGVQRASARTFRCTRNKNIDVNVATYN